MSTPSPAGAGAPRKRRADAERNRKRALDAARELFAQGGSSVSMDEVARRAELGIGTIYRHFPTKEALLEAAFRQRFGEILAYYRTVCRDSADPIEALRLLMVHIGEVERTLVCASVAENALVEMGLPGDVHADLEVEFVELVRKGQIEGNIRDDIVGADIFSLTCGLASIVHRSSGDWRRYITIVLDGLRAARSRTGQAADTADAAPAEDG